VSIGFSCIKATSALASRPRVRRMRRSGLRRCLSLLLGSAGALGNGKPSFLDIDRLFVQQLELALDFATSDYYIANHMATADTKENIR
jgi:hypothetical protein